MRNFIVTCLILISTIVLSSLDSAAQIKLAWDANTPPVAGYKVYYGTASRTYGIPINVGSATTYTLKGLSPAVTYYIAVTAYNSPDCESDYSNEVSGMITETVGSPNMLTGPTSGITGRSYSYTTGGLTSSSLGNPVQYQFDWNGDGSTNLSAWGLPTRLNTWTVAGTHQVRARARSAVHTSVVSNWSGPLSVLVSQAGSYTVATNPLGLQITVDGVTYTAPQSFSWTPRSLHTIAVPRSQPGVPGVRYVFASWSDGKAPRHSIRAPSSGATYIAKLRTQYSLTTSANPAGTGTVFPSRPTWHAIGQRVPVFATAKSGYVFSNWSGDLSGTRNPTSIIMNSPKNVTVNFITR